MNLGRELWAIVRKSEPLGVRKLPDGTILIGHVPQVAPEAYLHNVFPGLDRKGLNQIESLIGQPLPEPLRRFYTVFNGLDLFSSSLAIFGLRANYSRSGDDAWQPFDITLPNVDERIDNANDDTVFFGSYEWDGSLLYMNAEDPSVYRCSRESVEPLNQWSTLEEALIQETRRLDALFDTKGRKIDENRPTTP